jgi:hypothetical protein
MRGLDVRRLLGAVLACTVLAVSPAGAQRERPRAADERMAARDVQQLFDAYVLMQAQERLALSDQQYPQFVQRLKALQNARRESQAARVAIIQELSRTLAGKTGSSADEVALKDGLRRLRETDERSAADVRRAADAVDQVLDVRQQARFRVLEAQMERRKVELLLRARQAARAGRGSVAEPEQP